MIYRFIILILVLLFEVTGCSYKNENPDMELSGNIIMPSPNLGYASSEYFLGLLELNLETKNERFIFNDKACIEPYYNEDKSKILFIWNWKSIYEYDCDSKSFKLLVEHRGENSRISYAMYIPKNNNISYVTFDNRLIIFNLDKCIKEREIKNVDSVGGFSWSKDGKSFIYHKASGGCEIFKYNLESNESEYLFDGLLPVYSNNSDYIAYYKVDGIYSKIYIRNLETQEEKESCYSGQYFKFSPDDTKLAYIVSSGYYEWDLIVWDFETDEHCVVMKNVANRCGFDWKS